MFVVVNAEFMIILSIFPAQFNGTDIWLFIIIFILFFLTIGI